MCHDLVTWAFVWLLIFPPVKFFGGTQSALADVVVRDSVLSFLHQGRGRIYISELTVERFRAFNQPFNVKLNKGLTVMVGENGVGKTGVISALRQLFVDSEAGRYAVDDQLCCSAIMAIHDLTDSIRSIAGCVVFCAASQTIYSVR